MSLEVISELHWLIITQPMATRITQRLGRVYNKDCALTQDYKKRKQLFRLQELINLEKTGKLNIEEVEQAAIHNAIEVLAGQGCEFVRAEGLSCIVGANEIIQRFSKRKGDKIC